MQALKNFRTYFFRGMAALLPTILTIWIFVQCYVFIQDKVSIHINKALVWLILQIIDEGSKEFLDAFWVYGGDKVTGFFVTVIGVVILGAFPASVMGRSLWHFFERAWVNIPLVKQVYPYIKQVTGFFLIRKELSFNKVVAVEYPRKGSWSVGLVTGRGLQGIARNYQKEFLTVFVPTSPTPFTGFVISGGVITPTEHRAFQDALHGQEVKQTAT